MTNWIKLKKNLGTSIQDFYIEVYNIDGIERTGSHSCRVWNYNSDGQYHMEVAESAEDVIAKIKEAEETPAPVVERFTREEYRLLLTVVEDAQKQYGEKTRPADVLRSIEKTIKDILDKEDK